MIKQKASAPIPIDGGPPCPKCGRLMQRFTQLRCDRSGKPLFTRQWDHCRPCREDPWLAQVARTRGVKAAGFRNYEAYLASPHWQSLRQRVLEEQRIRLQRNVCEDCGKEGLEFDIHHRTYERLGNERIEDCQIFCEQCHYKLHGRDPKNQSRHYADR